MKFSSVIVSTLLSSLVASSPVPKVKVVYVTEYTTIKVTSGTAPPPLITPAPTAPAETEVDASQISGFVNLAVDPEHDDNKDTTITSKAPEPTTTSTEPTTTSTTPTTTSTTPTTTSTTPTTTSQAPQPTTTSTKAPEPTTTSTSAAPSPTSGGGDDNTTGATYSGDGTYYEPYGGSCGWTNTIDDPIVAISATRYKEIMSQHNVANPNNNPVCGAKIKAWNPENGKSVVVTVVDSCPGCAKDDLDLSHFAFDSIADHALGRFKLKWQWLDKEY